MNTEDTNIGYPIDGNGLFCRLEQLMTTQRVFTNPQLTRRSLAEMLGTNERYLHQTIKQCAGLKYADYITRQRLTYAKSLLAHTSKKMIVAAVAEAAGFGSKVTFYRQFCGHYGVTPEEYRRQIAPRV